MKRAIIYSLIIVSLAAISFFFWDRDIAQFFAAIPQPIRDISELVTLAGDSKYSLVPSFLLFIYFRFKLNRLRESQAIFIWLSIAVSGIVADILKFIVGRSRPRLFLEQNIYGFDFFKAGHIWNSFPSGHSATAFSLGISLAFLFPKYRLWLLLAAFMIASSRIIITAHYFSDVLIGGLIGGLTVLVFEKYFASHKCYNIYQNGCKL